MTKESEPPTLLERVARGDDAAVAECIDRFGPLIWSIARRMLRDRGVAEDAVQDTFVDLWRSAHRYDSERSSETTFVATLARRRVIDRLRRADRIPEPEEIDDRVVADDRGLAAVEDSDEAARARRAIDRLEPKQREILVLSVDRGLSHSQIARHTGLPLGTVKSHIRRAFERVRVLLKEQVSAPGSGEVTA